MGKYGSIVCGGWLVLRSLYFMLNLMDLFANICQSEFSGRYDTFCNTQKRNITILSYCRIFRKLVSLCISLDVISSQSLLQMMFLILYVVWRIHQHHISFRSLQSLQEGPHQACLQVCHPVFHH